MFLCRTGRPSAAALVFKSPGSFLVQVTANKQKDLTLSLRTGHTPQRNRFVCASVGGVDSALVHLGKQPLDPHPAQKWDSSSGFVIAECRHLDLVDTVAQNLSKNVRTESGGLDIIRRPPVCAKRRHISRGGPAGTVWFAGNWGVSSCSAGTMQIRASSTAAGTKKSEEHLTDSTKGDEQNLKEPSAAEKAPVEPEPEGGKPNKTQQLKKVFKEYGAVGVSFHIGISLISLGMFYLLVSSGIDMTAVLCKLGFSEAVVSSKMAAGTSTFVLAYAIHKLFAPVRISITLVSVPLIVRHFRKTGLFKPPTPTP